jgi:hypothetical protein
MNWIQGQLRPEHYIHLQVRYVSNSLIEWVLTAYWRCPSESIYLGAEELSTWGSTPRRKAVDKRHGWSVVRTLNQYIVLIAYHTGLNVDFVRLVVLFKCHICRQVIEFVFFCKLLWARLGARYLEHVSRQLEEQPWTGLGRYRSKQKLHNDNVWMFPSEVSLHRSHSPELQLPS